MIKIFGKSLNWLKTVGRFKRAEFIASYTISLNVFISFLNKDPSCYANFHWIIYPAINFFSTKYLKDEIISKNEARLLAEEFKKFYEL